ncbi:MAG: hypothetical protein Ct9H300mP14_16490 [Gammaproteobacteria bacterium]|nr:MAG: hypothetical protein Ct9H300mP14_16490 [Gammaproteobacteria bacterium]
MGHIMPWKGRLTLTFIFGVLRVVRLSASGTECLKVLASKTKTPLHPLPDRSRDRGATVGGFFHWFESG